MAGERWWDLMLGLAVAALERLELLSPWWMGGVAILRWAPARDTRFGWRTDVHAIDLENAKAATGISGER
jgi:hypothetical protein